MDIIKIVSEIIEDQKKSPIDILGNNVNGREYNYLSCHKRSYARTVGDINALLPKGANILEIGPFLGVVSISLKKCGFAVTALDIPEFYNSPSLRKLFENNDIPFSGVNLRKNILPYEANAFDAVVICEVIEHLNFNPLPLLKEINRVLKKDGYIYVGMPNQASFDNRLKLLKGMSIHNPIEDFLKQLDKKENMIVGLHWREYTMSETVELLGKMGFETIKKYYFRGEQENKNSVKRSIKSLLIKLFPQLLPYQVVIGKKILEPNFNFWQTQANI